jgi:hypothetical protein
MTIFTELEKNPKIYMKIQTSLNSQSNSEQKEQCWNVTTPGFNLYLRATVTKQHDTGTKTDKYTNVIE